MSELNMWSPMMAHATAACTDAAVLKQTHSYAISPSEASDLASTGVAQLMQTAGLKSDSVFKKMLGAVMHNWDNPLASHVKPEAAAKPILEQIAKTTDRAQLTALRDAAATIRNDLERQRTAVDNAQVAPQLGQIQDFASAIAVAAERKLLAATTSAEPDGNARAASQALKKLHAPPAPGALGALVAPLRR